MGAEATAPNLHPGNNDRCSWSQPLGGQQIKLGVKLQPSWAFWHKSPSDGVSGDIKPLRLESPGPALPGPGRQVPEYAEAGQVSQVKTAAMPAVAHGGKGPSVGHAISLALDPGPPPPFHLRQRLEV